MGKINFDNNEYLNAYFSYMDKISKELINLENKLNSGLIANKENGISHLRDKISNARELHESNVYEFNQALIVCKNLDKSIDCFNK